MVVVNLVVVFVVVNVTLVVIVHYQVLFLCINVLLIYFDTLSTTHFDTLSTTQFDIFSIVITIGLIITGYWSLFVYLLTYMYFIFRNSLRLMLILHQILVKVTIFSFMELIIHILSHHLILLTLLSLYFQPLRGK